MAVYVLDTDTLSLYQRNQAQVRRSVAAHRADTLAVAVVTVEEQIGGWSGVARAARTPQQQEFASRLLAGLVPTWNEFALAPLTAAAVARFTQLVGLKLNVKRNDLRIAAVALELGAAVVTRNRRDFGRIPGLVVEDWSV